MKPNWRARLLLPILLLLAALATTTLRHRPLVGNFPPNAGTMPEPKPSSAPIAAPAPRPPPDSSTVVDETSEEFAFAAIAPGPLRDRIASLSPLARHRALQILLRNPVPREDYASLHVSKHGGLYYSCDFPVPPSQSTSRPDSSASSSPNFPSAGAAARVPISQPPIRHSRSGSPNVLYIDFNGHVITGTEWNVEQSVDRYDARPYDTDGDPTTFDGTEQSVIVEVWARVAEDFSPFDIDVTTEEPAFFTRTTGRALVTSYVDANGYFLPSSGNGGVAFLGDFGDSNYVSTYSPALVYYDNLGRTDAANIAAAVSHELGHNFGLSHDGKTDGTEYYTYHGTGDITWGPIMGDGYYSNVSQWSKGEYYLANNHEDDIAIIAAQTGYCADEAGDALSTAAPLGIADSSVFQTGILSNQNDADIFTFNTRAGLIDFSVDTYHAPSGPHGGNADIRLELINSLGAIVAAADPPLSTNASLSYNASAGRYYLRLTPAGTGSPYANPPTGYTSYGSDGQYYITGSIVPSSPLIIGSLSTTTGIGHPFTYSIEATNTPASYAAGNLPTGLVIDTTTGVISGRPATTGIFTVFLSATNAFGTTRANLVLTVTAAPPAILGQTTGLLTPAPGEPISLQVSALSPGTTFTCAWKHDGRLISGATDTTLSIASASRVDSGWYQPLLTNPTGTTAGQPIFVRVVPIATALYVWGSNDQNLLDSPPGNHRWIAVAASPFFSFALKANGSVAAWGDPTWGLQDVPAGLTDVAAIAAGSYHALALKTDGSVVAWGGDYQGEATPPEDLANVVAIAAGSSFSLALKADGSVVGWGYDQQGQTDPPAGLSEVVAITAGRDHALALRADGTVVAWGSDDQGQCNIPPDLDHVVAIAAGAWFSLALKDDGTVVGWGSEEYATPPGDLSEVVALACTDYHTLALKNDGSLAGWGYAPDDALEIPSTLNHVIDAAAGWSHSVALRDASGDTMPAITNPPLDQVVTEESTATFSVAATGGTSMLAYQWRKDGQPLSGATSSSLRIEDVTPAQTGNYDVVVSNQLGSVTSPSATLQVLPLPTVTPNSSRRQVFLPGQSVTLSASATGQGPLSYQWYHAGRPIPGATSTRLALASLTLADSGAYWLAATDSVGTRHGDPLFIFCVPASTAIKGWGGDAYGQASPPYEKTRYLSLAAGYSLSFALRADGTVLAWGDAAAQATVPDGLSDIVAITTSIYASYALRADGTLISWGSYFDPPVTPSGLTRVFAISTNQSFGLALKTNGTVVGWGAIGSPVTIPAGLDHVVAISAGYSHALALKADGTVVAWGSDDLGQCDVPAGLGHVTAIAAGNFHSLALLADGTVVAWGDVDSATLPAGLTSVTAIAASSSGNLALQTDGTPAAWGPFVDQFGAPPPNLRHVFAISAGYYHALALRDGAYDIAPTIVSDPIPASAPKGGTVRLGVTTSGSPVLYQWRRDGMPLYEPASVRSATLVLSGVTLDQAGNYDVVVSNAAGSATSLPTRVTVDPPLPLTNDAFAEAIPLTGFSGNTSADTSDATAETGETQNSGHTVWFAWTAPASGSWQFETIDASFSTSLRVFTGSSLAHLSLAAEGDYFGNDRTSRLTLTTTAGVTYYIQVEGLSPAAYGYFQLGWNPISYPHTYDTYQLTHFDASQLSDVTVSGPAADPDHDGLANLLEYALDLDPLAPDTDSVLSTSVVGDYLTTSYTRRSDTTDITCTIEVAADAGLWYSGPNYTNVISTVTIDATHERITVRDLTPISSSPRRFIRLKVTRD